MKRKLTAILTATLAVVILAGCAPQTDEQQVQDAADRYIATATSDSPEGLCAEASITSGITADATVTNIEQLHIEMAEGRRLFEVDVTPRGYLQVEVRSEGACVRSAVPWSG